MHDRYQAVVVRDRARSDQMASLIGRAPADGVPAGRREHDRLTERITVRDHDEVSIAEMDVPLQAMSGVPGHRIRSRAEQFAPIYGRTS